MYADTGQHRSREQALDDIAAMVERCRGYNHGNPRYFAEMFAATMACVDWQEQIVLAELECAVRRIEARQEKSWWEAAEADAAMLADVARRRLEELS